MQSRLTVIHDPPTAKDLTQQDIKCIKAFVFGHETGLSADGHGLLRHLFPELSLDSLYVTRTRVADLAALVIQTFDACPKGCMAFTGRYSSPVVYSKCRWCGEKRHDEHGKRRGVFSYLDPAQLLKIQLENKQRRAELNYPHEQGDVSDRIRDYIDCTHFKNLQETFIPNTPGSTRLKFFANVFHVPLLLLADGIGIWRKLSVWPIVALNLALAPTKRNRIDELLLLGLVHGSPKDLDTFLHPIVQGGIKATEEGFSICPEGTVVKGRYSFVLSGADARGKEKWTLSKGSNAICGCLECRIVGVRDVNAPGTCHYRPTTVPDDLDLGVFPRARNWDPFHLDKRTSRDYLLDARMVELSENRADASKRVGIRGVPLLSTLPGFDIILSCPNEYLHLLPLNNCKNLIKMWCGTFGLPEGKEKYQFLPGGLKECGRRIVAARSMMPTLFGRPIPDPSESLHLWTGSDYSSFFQFYAPWALRDLLPSAAYDHAVLLWRIMNRINQRSITYDEIDEVERWIAEFVLEWER